MPDDFQVTLSADTSDLLSKLDEAKAKAEETAEGMHGAFEEGGGGMAEAMEGMGEAMEGFKERADGMLENLTSLAGGWTGLLSVIGAGAVGELLEHISETTLEVGDSMRNTGAALQVSSDDARGFNEAMSSLGVSSTAATQAIRRLEMDASNGGKSLERLGVSATTASGATKSGMEIFTEVVEKINNLSDANQKAEAAFTLLGRGGIQLLGVMDQINPAIEEATAKQRANSDTNALAVEQSLKLHAALTDLKSAFEDGIIKESPLVVSALKVIEAELQGIIGYCQAAATAIMAVFTAGGALGKVVGDVGGVMNAMSASGGGPEGFSAQTDATAKLAAAQSQLASDTASYGDTMAKTAKDLASIPDVISKAKASADNLMRQALHQGEYGPAQGFEGEYKTQPSGDEGGQWAPKGGGGRGGGKGGGGGSDPLAGMESSLQKSDAQMTKLAGEFDKLGSESQMASKVSADSFDTLRDRAQNDYAVMLQKHQEFAAAVAAGSKDAAKTAENNWHEAAQKFQTDWDQAKQRAQADMQQIKSTADQMASEVSGILNQAISGKLNWAQEFDKILSQMLDKLVKHLMQQVAMWIAHEAQVNATKATGLATGLALQKTANAQAGTSDAIGAAKGAWNSAAQIPYIGYIIAPLAAAAAFAGVEAYGSAEGGYSVPPGESPMIQAHPRELVMPANLSEGFRDIIRNGGGGRGGTVNQNLNIQSLDPSKLADIVMSNPDIFGQAAALSRRNGARFNTG